MMKWICTLIFCGISSSYAQSFTEQSLDLYGVGNYDTNLYTVRATDGEMASKQPGREKHAMPIFEQYSSWLLTAGA